MTEESRPRAAPTPNDRELEQYLKGDSRLSRRYREASGERTPPELDEAILAQARAELRRKPNLSRWLAPAALAASLVLAVNLAWNLYQVESPPAPAAPPPLAKAPAEAAAPVLSTPDAPPPAPAPERRAAKPPAAVAEERKQREAESVAAQARAESEPHAILEEKVEAANRARLQAQEGAGAAALAEAPASSADRAPVQPKARADSLRSGVLPRGWVLAGSTPGDYDAGTDESVSSSKTSSLYLWCSNPGTSGFGTVMTRAAAERYRGTRVRLTADVQTQDVGDWAGLWMRVDGGEAESFDNMANRPIRGDTPWRSYSVVLDVSASASALSYGVLLHGKGTVWVDQIRVEVVGPEVPVTNLFR